MWSFVYYVEYNKWEARQHTNVEKLECFRKMGKANGNEDDEWIIIERNNTINR